MPNSVVIDANVWVSAIIHGGNNEKVITYCLENTQIVASEIIEQELTDYFKYQTTAPQRWRRQFRLNFEKTCTIVSTEDLPISKLRDPKDVHVLRAAIDQQCPLVITGDKDLLELDVYQGVTILSPAEFIELAS